MMRQAKIILKHYSVVIVMTILTLGSLIIALVLLATFKAIEGNGFMLLKTYGLNDVLYGDSTALQVAIIFLLVLTPVFAILTISWLIYLLLTKNNGNKKRKLKNN